MQKIRKVFFYFFVFQEAALKVKEEYDLLYQEIGSIAQKIDTAGLKACYCFFKTILLVIFKYWTIR